MKNLTNTPIYMSFLLILTLFMILLVLPFITFAATSYPVSGLCAVSSSNYGQTFFDVSNGNVVIDGTGYQFNGVMGLLAQNNMITNVYVYRPAGSSNVVIGTANVNSNNTFFETNGILVAKVYAGAQVGFGGGVITNFENYTADCSNYKYKQLTSSNTVTNVISSNVASNNVASVNQMAGVLEAARELLNQMLASLKVFGR